MTGCKKIKKKAKSNGIKSRRRIQQEEQKCEATQKRMGSTHNYFVRDKDKKAESGEAKWINTEQEKDTDK